MIGWLLRLLVVCFIVGFVLVFFHIRPDNLVGDTFGSLREIIDTMVRIGRWAWPYIRYGAIIVVPIALIALIFGLLRRR